MNNFKNQVSVLLNVAMKTFGEEITYTSNPQRGDDGEPKKILAIFDNEYQQVDPETGVVVSSTAPRIGIRLIDLPKAPKQGDRALIQEKEYKVVEVQEDGQGGAALLLHDA